MVPIFLLAISFLTAMRIWFSLGTFVNLLETKADRNHLFPRARKSPPQTRSSSFDLPWGIFATICSTKALRSNKWAGETPYNHKVRMKQQTSLKPCHISCQGSLFGISFVCSAWLQTRAKANPFKTYDIEKTFSTFLVLRWYHAWTLKYIGNLCLIPQTSQTTSPIQPWQAAAACAAPVCGPRNIQVSLG